MIILLITAPADQDLNQALLASGQTINVKLENNELFGVQQKSLFGRGWIIT
jgi:hypothetical protein